MANCNRCPVPGYSGPAPTTRGSASSLDALAASVGIFGAGRFELLYASDLDSLRQMADELAGVAR